MTVLMAPGGSPEMSIAALECGADSVYIGPKGWSRRPKSDELDDQEMAEVLGYGVRHGKDIRVAINVMPCPTEINLFLSKIERYAGLGAAGVMICDPGCVELVHRHFPELEIHVSVTAGIFNLQDVLFYRDLGARLAVIPYRWGAKEIAELGRQPGIDLEAFLFQTMHRGRICPGRCYASSYFHISHIRDAENKDQCIGSASRGGSCHRICRGDWEMRVDEIARPESPTLKGTPELLLWEMPEYVALGVKRFKIPGRERSVTLVCDIVGFYRRALDHVLAGGLDMSPFADEWAGIKERWRTERGKRDNARIDAAESIAV